MANELQVGQQIREVQAALKGVVAELSNLVDVLDTVLVSLNKITDMANGITAAIADKPLPLIDGA